MTALSVIIPVYNGERFLEQCVHSVCSQSITDIQILIVNDGSTDGSGVLADTLAAKDSRIQVIHQTNKGLSGARNSGMDHAVGEFVAFLDADDWVDTDMYATLYRAAQLHDADLCVGGTIVERGNGNVERIIPPFATGVMERNAIEKHFLPTTLAGRSLEDSRIFMSTAWLSIYSNKLLKHEKIQYRFNVRNEDTLFNLEFADACKRIAIVHSTGHHYRKNAGSMTEKHYKALRPMLEAGDMYWDRFRDRSPILRQAWMQRKFVSMSTEFKNIIAPGTPHQGLLALRKAFAECISTKWDHELLSLPDYAPKARYQAFIVGLARKRQYILLLLAYSIRARIDKEAVST